MVAGSATIGGTTVAIDAQPGNYGRVTEYAVLHADGGLTGAATTTSNTATLEPWLTRTDSTLFVTLLRTDLPLQPYATTTNGAAVGHAFDQLRPAATGDLANVTRELTALDDPALATALDAVSGEIHASALQLAALDGEAVMDLVRDEVGRRAAPGEVDADTPIPPVSPSRPRRHVWSQLHGQRSTFDGASSAHGGDARLQGFAVGADWPLLNGWFVGVGGALHHRQTDPRWSRGIERLHGPTRPWVHRVREQSMDSTRWYEHRTHRVQDTSNVQFRGTDSAR